MDCIHVAQDGDKWWALVNIVMNIHIPQNAGNFLIAEELLVHREVPCSMRSTLFHGVSCCRNYDRRPILKSKVSQYLEINKSLTSHLKTTQNFNTVFYLQVGLGSFAAGKFQLLHFPKQCSGWM